MTNNDISDLIGSPADLEASAAAAKQNAAILEAAAKAFEESTLLGEAVACDPDTLDYLGGEQISPDEMDALDA